MSKKIDKKLRRFMKRRQTPKEIAGVKVSKSLRRVADSPLGAAIIAHLLVGRTATDKADPATNKLRHEVHAIAGEVAEALASLDADGSVAVAEGSKKRPRSRPTARAVTH